MSFAQPLWLWGLAGVGLFALTLILLAIGRHTHATRAVRWPRIARVVASASGVRPINAGRTVRRPWLMLFALAVVLLALARPRWGTVEEEVIEQAREVMIALDLSRSMLVADVPPSRLERAKLLTKSLLDNLRGERVGIIVFAGTAFVQVPLSPDYQIIHEFLPELSPNYMPQGGTDFEGMLHAAIGGFGDAPNTDRFLIVLSDGESHSTAWRELLPSLRERGIRALTLGVGTPAGGFIPDQEGGYVKDERGAVVLSKLEPATLRSLANETQGVFRQASDWVDLATLIESTIARGREGQFATRRAVREIERFQWFLAPAVLLGLLGLWREVAIRTRQRTVHGETRPHVKTGASTTATAAALVLLFATMPSRSPAADSAPPADDSPEARVRATITRLADADRPSARDWRELADRTLVYGTGARMNQQPIEPGVIRDALAAVALGEQADPRLTDWAKLRAELEALLETPPQEQPPPPEPPPEQSPEQEQSQDQSESEKSPQSPESQSENSDAQSSPQPEQEQAGEPQPSQPQSQPQQPAQPPDSRPSEGELGELGSESDQEPPPDSPPRNAGPPPKTRKIGGREDSQPAEPVDAESAVLQQRLREAAEKDSPARLFQLLEGEKKQPAPRGRDW